jgi:hypothetical protein
LHWRFALPPEPGLYSHIAESINNISARRYPSLKKKKVRCQGRQSGQVDINILKVQEYPTTMYHDISQGSPEDMYAGVHIRADPILCVGVYEEIYYIQAEYRNSN